MKVSSFSGVHYKNVLQAYTDDLIAGQFDKAYELCGPDFRLQLSPTQFIEQQAQLQQKYGRLLSIKRQGMKLSGTGEPVFWSGQYSADLNYEHATRRFEFAFRKHDGRWVLYGYQEMGAVNRS